MHDLVIRGGTVIDGTGGVPFAADIAVDCDRITAVGKVDGRGRQEIDAIGLTVTPGFIDVHTHLDAQIGWDPFLTPVCRHGVTTVLLGNCGVTFAPVRDNDKAVLASMMESVEDIPAASILSGLAWNWQSYGDYLESVASLKPAINVAGLVGHCAVRFYVMGERAVDDQPSDDEITRMARTVAESISAGAIGFSTSRLLMHTLPDGRHIPGTLATGAELKGIVRAAAARGGCLVQCAPNLDTPDREMGLVEELASIPGARVLFNMTTGSEDAAMRFNATLEAACAGGRDITAITYPRGSGVLVGLVNVLPWLQGAWEQLGRAPFGERLAMLDDGDFRTRLVADAGGHAPAFPLAEIFWLGETTPDYRFTRDHNLQRMAAARGEHPAATFLRMSRETKGQALFIARLFNHNRRAVETLICGAHVLPSLGDAGAHVGLIMDAGWCTYVLTELVRDTGLFTLAEAVRRMTSAPARVMGLSDRGRLEPGMRADINVIDLDALAPSMPEYVNDFPGGAGRFVQRASGYRATICNGEAVVADDDLTGARPGRVLKH